MTSENAMAIIIVFAAIAGAVGVVGSVIGWFLIARNAAMLRRLEEGRDIEDPNDDGG